jgi:hypothetical protein
LRGSLLLILFQRGVSLRYCRFIRRPSSACSPPALLVANPPVHVRRLSRVSRKIRRCDDRFAVEDHWPQLVVGLVVGSGVGIFVLRVIVLLLLIKLTMVLCLGWHSYTQLSLLASGGDGTKSEWLINAPIQPAPSHFGAYSTVGYS